MKIVIPDSRAQRLNDPGEAPAGRADVNQIAFAPRTLRLAPTGLRSYPANSAHAAARIVALALISNGRIKSVEAATLGAADAHALLGIDRQEWYAVLRHLRLDLLHVDRSHGFSISQPALERLLDDISDRELQRTVAALSVAVIHADRRLAPGEQAFLEALQRRWDMAVHPEPCALLLRERVLQRKSSPPDRPERLAA